MTPYTPPSAAKYIPVIDLTKSFSASIEDRKSVAWEVHKACRDIGFFYVSNHGVSQELMDSQLQIAREFFALPIAEKLQIDARKSRCMRGYEAMSSQTLDDGSQPDLKEGFMAGRDCDGDHPYVRQAVPYYYDMNQWPQGLPTVQAATERYIGEMTGLGRHILRVLALSLELPEDYFAPGLAEPMVTTRLLHYPPQARVGSGNQIGAGAHTDWGIITMLLQDDVGGLEVQNADGDWIRAPHIPGTFVINLGDMVPLLTNGLYHSNSHRVLNLAPDRHRYSVPTFFDPDYFYKMLPVRYGQEASEDSTAVSVGEHIAEMYRRSYGMDEAAA
ncbi:isopenicillin N synthase family oxygenase [Cupriavidus sp. D384]|uniref:isopenicillin N synthase family dioxygenase n=1 Tax=Cupriavidus sp. D384 TaxID=1538095 RepID=UPI00083570EC|nr:2-oxoglutarate and iron-dependent oxygenase domain-containing protein [Cupriavidus sp. D384]